MSVAEGTAESLRHPTADSRGKVPDRRSVLNREAMKQHGDARALR